MKNFFTLPLMLALFALTSCAASSVPMNYQQAYDKCTARKNAALCHAEAQNYCLNNPCIWG